MRLAIPRLVAPMAGASLMASALLFGAAVWIAIGAILCFFGYVR